MIPQIKKILFTTDLSENSRHAFYYAASMATRYGGGLIILHVKEKLPMSAEQTLSGFFGEEKWKEMQKQHEQEARQILIGKKRDHDLIRKSLDVFCNSANIDSDHCSFETHEIIVKEGKIVEEITRLAKEKGCDLIVMGSHKGLLGSTAVGSITRGVLQHSSVPVLVVPPPEAA